MSNSYRVKINDSYEIAVKDTAIDTLDVIPKGKNKFQIIEKNKTFKIETISNDFKKKKYQISVNGNKYLVAIKDELDVLIKKLGLSIGTNKKEKDIKAPMPGLILELLVSEGQEVKEGDSLLVLEAMKMENMLVASIDGKVKAIHVKITDAVEKKQLLIEME